MSDTQSECDLSAPFLMWIEDVFTVLGNGTTITGYVERGSINLHDPIDVVGLQQTRRIIITDVEQGQRLAKTIVGGMQAGILLRRMDRRFAEIGQVLAAPDSIHAYMQFECEAHILSEAAESGYDVFNSNGEAEYFFRTVDISGTYTVSDEDRASREGKIRFNCKLRQPIAMETGTEFDVLLRGKRVAAGIVVAPLA